MAKAMSKAQIVDYLAGRTGTTKKAANQFLDELARLAYKEAKNSFTVPGIGKLVVVSRKARMRMGRNPQTGEAIKVPAPRVVRFRVAKAVKVTVLATPSEGPAMSARGGSLLHGLLKLYK